jgi:hypothetical protein
MRLVQLSDGRICQLRPKHRRNDPQAVDVSVIATIRGHPAFVVRLPPGWQSTQEVDLRQQVEARLRALRDASQAEASAAASDGEPPEAAAAPPTRGRLGAWLARLFGR